MLLQDNFFQFTSPQANGNIYTSTISLQEDHRIFAGHFPSQPVVPGVCIIQTIKEIVSSVIQQPVRLSKADNIKFLSFIDPRIDKTVEIELRMVATDQATVAVAAVLRNSQLVFCKFNGEFIAGDPA